MTIADKELNQIIKELRVKYADVEHKSPEVGDFIISAEDLPTQQSPVGVIEVWSEYSNLLGIDSMRTYSSKWYRIQEYTFIVIPEGVAELEQLIKEKSDE